MSLKKCSLCVNMEDPRFGVKLHDRRYPLCDGCGGPENDAQWNDLVRRLNALPIPAAEWRVGRSQGRTLYRDEKLVGMVDSTVLAEHMVKALNEYEQKLAKARSERASGQENRSLGSRGTEK